MGDMASKKIQFKGLFSFLYSTACSLVIWRIFSPGIMSLDSLYMYLEATSRFAYTDEKALLLPLIFSIFTKLGGSFSLFILIQCLAGFLAIRQLSLLLAAYLGIGERISDLIALFVMIILSSPLFLLSVYLVTFWMDTWLGILLLWALALLLELYARTDLDSTEFTIKVILLVLCISSVLLIRLNSLVLFPALVASLLVILYRRRVHPSLQVIYILTPLIIFMLSIFFQYQVLKVKKTHPVYSSYALDLASVLKLDPSICEKSLLSACDEKVGYFPCNFVVGEGAVDCTYDQEKRIIYTEFYLLRNNTALETDYWFVVRNYPLELLEVKILNFMDYLRPVSYRYYYQKESLIEKVGLVSDPGFSNLRNRVFGEIDWVSLNPILRWFSFVHLSWLVIDVLGIIACIMLAMRSIEKDKFIFFALILSIPASYYFSYLIALTASDFRFMYPSTLVMQVITLTFLASFLLRVKKD